MASVDIIKRNLVRTIDAMKKNIEKFKKAKTDTDKKKYAKIAYKLQDEKKKLAKDLDAKISGIHKDAELQIDEQTLRKQLRTIILSEIQKKSKTILTEATTTNIAGQTKSFVPGQMWSNDFDYVGMLKFGASLQIPDDGGRFPDRITRDPEYIKMLNDLFDSFEDVNYHRESQDLGNAIDWIEDAKGIEDMERAVEFLEKFKKKCAATLDVMKVKWSPGR
tara:strand:- start:446 stop:1105 length:660 start_codon:yes stop_codon:yes gene_type:complete